MSKEFATDKIHFPQTITVTDQEIDISKLSVEQKDFYLNLAEEIIQLYHLKNIPRLVIGIAGPGGSGKSVSVAILKEILEQSKLPFKLEQIGIDGFTYPNEYLLSNFDQGKPLKDFKGRYDTFDTGKLLRRLLEFRAGKAVSLPAYSRAIHDPVENAIHIDGPNVVLLLEGLWLLHDEKNWKRIKSAIDFIFFFEADKNISKDNVIKRHVRGGRTPKDAVRQWEENDSKNYDIITKEKKRADKILKPWGWSRI